MPSSRTIHVSPQELDEIKAILRAVLKDKRVLVFGSRARGTHRKTSDLDLAIEGKASLSLADRSKLELQFSESSLPFRVDIVDLHTADESFRTLIQGDSIPLDYALSTS